MCQCALSIIVTKPQPLTGRGFWRQTSNRGPSPGHYCGRPQIRERLNLNMPIGAIAIARADVRGSVSVAGNASTAAGAGKHPPPWCYGVAILAHATGARAVIFRQVFRRDPVLPGLVLNIPKKLAVRPLAHPLVVLAAFVDAVRDVAHVSDRQMGYLLLMGKGDQLAAGFMQDIPALAVERGRRAGLAA